MTGQPNEPVVITDRDDIPWDHAPLPRHRHRCQPQTTITGPRFPAIHICACGGVTGGLLDGDNTTTAWTRRNYRRGYTRWLSDLPTLALAALTPIVIVYTLAITPANTIVGILFWVILAPLLVFVSFTSVNYLTRLKTLAQSEKRLDQSLQKLRTEPDSTSEDETT